MIRKTGTLGLMVLTLATFARAEKFRAHDLPGTGAGYTMPTSSFTYFRLHETIQTADIDNDGNIDIVVLADGNLPENDDYAQTATGAIFAPDYLAGLGGLGRESPNVRLGKPCCPDPLISESHVGSDLAWYKNDGFGYFFPIHVSPFDPTLGYSTHAFIYNGKSLAVGNLRGLAGPDTDQDIVVWTSTGTFAGDNALGTGRVCWFENRLSEGETYLVFPDNYPHFRQHDVITPNNAGLFYVAPTSYSITNPRAGTLADMNGDGNLDLIVLNYDGAGAGKSGLYWFQNTGLAGDNMFQPTAGNLFPVVYSGSTIYNKPYGITVVAADLDGMNGMDLVIGENGTLGSGTRQVVFLKNRGDNTFDRTNVKSDFYVSRSVAVADVIPGGCMEIVAGGKPADSPLTVFQNASAVCSSAWTSSVLSGAGTIPEIWDIRLVDLDGDGLQDILAFSVLNTGHPALAAGETSLATGWINTPGTAPSGWPSFPIVEEKTPPTAVTTLGGGLALGDFDRDGDTDAVRAHFGTNLAFYENVWNTERTVEIRTTANKNGVKQTVTSVLGTQPNRTAGKIIRQRVQ